ncbi:MAG: FAD-binding protein, partial [Candidatus Gallimonas sp.]
AVFNESRTRKVYMDFTREPSCLNGDFPKLSAEAYGYLNASGALVEKPVERLKIMNAKAVGLYREHGIDLEKEPLRVAVCAQHHNGGFDTDKDYMTCVNGLYAAGECAGTFGIFRPGGTALNSTQVSGNRIADKIACEERKGGEGDAESAAEELRELIVSHKGKSGILSFRERMQGLMSENFAFIRDTDNMKTAYSALLEGYENFSESKWERLEEIPSFLKNRDMIITQLCVAAGMIYTADHAGSRGGAIVTRKGERIGEEIAYRSKRILVGFCGKPCVTERQVRPLPEERELWFEKVWNEYEKRRGK